jgi:type I restriction enzyme M protein
MKRATLSDSLGEGKPWSAKPHWRLKLWIYDLRTNKHFTLKENPLKRVRSS